MLQRFDYQRYGDIFEGLDVQGPPIRPVVDPALRAAAIILNGIEMVHMMRKQQVSFAFNPDPSPSERFKIVAA
uniref:Orf10Fr n=1 Tax=Mesorhizobium sp. CJ1 TaxID=447687 RepID=A6N7V7_9HYPH|nr:Orf10Fr [Mesorhizobium sp. CJ1]